MVQARNLTGMHSLRWTPAPWTEENEDQNVQLHPERIREIKKGIIYMSTVDIGAVLRASASSRHTHSSKMQFSRSFRSRCDLRLRAFFFKLIHHPLSCSSQICALPRGAMY